MLCGSLMSRGMMNVRANTRAFALTHKHVYNQSNRSLASILYSDYEIREGNNPWRTINVRMHRWMMKNKKS